MNREILSWIQQKVRIVVYPAGKQTGWLLKHTLLAEANVVAISDRNTALHGKPFHDHPVVAPQEILAYKPDIVLVAADLHRIQIFRDIQFLHDEGVEIVAL